MQQYALHDRKTSLTFGETAVRRSFCLPDQLQMSAFGPKRTGVAAATRGQCPQLGVKRTLTNRCPHTGGIMPTGGEWMRLGLAALLLMLLTPASADASCATMQALAQEHANDMARRGSMDHNGFASRARRGARAENVAYGVKTKQQAIALWWSSSGHAANMRLPGCKAVASAVGHTGTRYWAMVIGN